MMHLILIRLAKTLGITFACFAALWVFKLLLFYWMIL